MGEIIPFTKEKQECPPQNIQEVDELLYDYKIIHVHESLEALSKLIFHHISLLGFNELDISDTKIQKQEALITESIRSYLLQNYEISHPLQKLSEKIFKDDDNGIILDNNINIILRNKKTRKIKEKA